MNGYCFYIAGSGKAMVHAGRVLMESGIRLSAVPDDSVTHLLLEAPAFDAHGQLRCGEDLGALLEKLPDTVTIMGGNLNHPLLEGMQTVDLLQDEMYLAQNAAITAHCAALLGANRLNVTLQECPILVIGWGRIGKCLARLLRQMGANVTVAARKESDRAMLRALGYTTENPHGLYCGLRKFRLIYNTAPAPILPQSRMCYCRGDCVKIDLASRKGIEGSDVVWARGLPGKDAPESSGELIARTVLRLMDPREGTE